MPSAATGHLWPAKGIPVIMSALRRSWLRLVPDGVFGMDRHPTRAQQLPALPQIFLIAPVRLQAEMSDVLEASGQHVKQGTRMNSCALSVMDLGVSPSWRSR